MHEWKGRRNFFSQGMGNAIKAFEAAIKPNGWYLTCKIWGWWASLEAYSSRAREIEKDQ